MERILFIECLGQVAKGWPLYKMPGHNFISPDFSKIRDSRNSVGRMGQGKGLAGGLQAGILL